MCLPAVAMTRLFDGVHSLLRLLHGWGLRTVVVTNAFWRTADDYRRDFEAFGVASDIDAVVSSVDDGYRKPHLAIFARAIEAARLRRRKASHRQLRGERYTPFLQVRRHFAGIL
jgi:FMN phosphatase YigB (HAD superfamily)